MNNSFSEGAAWVNGNVVPIGKASIAVNDWGLIHSDITYDVAPVFNGAFFRLRDYLDRFFNSMNKLRLDPNMTRSEIEEALKEMVGMSGMRESYVAMVCSRGVPKIGGTRNPADCKNHFYAWCVPYIHVIKPEVAKAGATALISKNVTRIPDTSIDPTIKNYHWGDFTRGLFEAKDDGYETVILIDKKENVTEGPGFNVFAVKGNSIITPDHGILKGISRKTVLEMADELKIEAKVRPLPLSEFLNSDEVFISTSGGGIIPIVKVDKTIFSNGRCGAKTRIFCDTYWKWFNSSKYRTKIDYHNP